MKEAHAPEVTPIERTDYFGRYMSSGFSQIQGWPGNRQSVEFNLCFRSLLLSQGEEGGVCEIGVHHGKYLIALHNIFGNRRSLGIDLFEQQDSNIDRSGKGDMNVCAININKYANNPQLVKLRSMDSLSLLQKDLDVILDEFGKFALFSIDGGHTKLHVNIDLDNAARLTSDKGIIIVDDIFHPDWPEVTEGLYSSINSQRTPFVPFLLTRKKLYLCNAGTQARYSKFSLDSRGKFSARMVRFAGWPIPSINFGSEY